MYRGRQGDTNIVQTLMYSTLEYIRIQILPKVKPVNRRTFPNHLFVLTIWSHTTRGTPVTHYDTNQDSVLVTHILNKINKCHHNDVPVDDNWQCTEDSLEPRRHLKEQSIILNPHMYTSNSNTVHLYSTHPHKPGITALCYSSPGWSS